MKNKLYLVAMCCLATLALPACGEDDDDDFDTPDPEKPSVVSNPMVGKTIYCIEKYDSFNSRVNTNFSITFKATEFVQVLKQTASGKIPGGGWEDTFYLDKTEEGTYTYSDTQIELSYYSGGKTILTKVDGGWQDGNYLYK